jgi:ATP synthase protein I
MLIKDLLHNLLTILLKRGCVIMKQNNRHPLQSMALMSAILSQLVGSVLVGIFGGRWLDGQFGTEPLFLIIGLLVGLAAGVYAMLKLIQHYFSGE